MIVTKSLRNSIVRLTTAESGGGWTVKVEVDGEIVHNEDAGVYDTEDEALQAGDEYADAAAPHLH
ncbi:hypothetical protein [Undibacterium sp.]|uniref:hypothetical protein n=1 Tax=Undibacterium sp. TaxID=1914977 RepID=UPI00374D3DF8